MQDVNNGGNLCRGEVEEIYGNSVLSALVFYKPKTSPLKSLFFFNVGANVF